MNSRNIPQAAACIVMCITVFNCVQQVKAGAPSLEERFRNPPDATRPLCYWYWFGGHVSKEGVTKDLEAMARVGLGGAMIGNIAGRAPRGFKAVQVFTDEWYDLTRHALREAKRLGIKIYFFNCAGWSQSGGPWVKPEQAMRMVAWDESPGLTGQIEIDYKVDFKTKEVARDQVIAVLAVPHQEHTVIEGKNQEDSTRFTSDKELTVRSLRVFGNYEGKLYAVINGKEVFVDDIKAFQGNGRRDFMYNTAVTFSFPDTTAREFILRPAIEDKGRIKGWAKLSTQPMVARVAGKQLGRLAKRDDTRWDSYIFPKTVEPKNGTGIIDKAGIIDLTDKLDAQGQLKANLPPGTWDILRFRMKGTEAKNHPAPREAQGLEVDKMNRQHVRHHLDSMFGPLLSKVTPDEKAAWVGLNIDSWEVNVQNWTDGFREMFMRRNDYDPIPLLPVLTGRIVGSAKASDQWLWDLRRTVADLIAENYIGELTRFAHENGMVTWTENYGPWGFPAEFTNYGGHADEIGGTFWTEEISMEPDYLNNLASSAAHTYGKKRVYAEAFTRGRAKQEHHPYMLKSRGEQIFARGVNHFVIHLYLAQVEDAFPGNNRWGLQFHRNTPWFGQSREWVRYLQRCFLMLQDGNPGVDVAVYIGDFAPQQNGPVNPVPEGYDFDYIGSDAILRKLDVVDGEWVIHDEKDPDRIAVRYRLLAIPENIGYVRPKVKQRLEALRKKGGAVLNTARLDAEDLTAAGLRPWISQASTTIKWKVRESPKRTIYFISNFGETGPFEATFRTVGRQPVLYDPVSGESRRLAHYINTPKGTRIHLNIKDKSESYFIVFSEKTANVTVKKVEGPGSEDLFLSFGPKGKLVAETMAPFDVKLTLSDGSRFSYANPGPSAPMQLKGAWNKKKVDPNGHVAIFDSTFQLAATYPKNERVYLDLSISGVMATVTLNGHRFPTDWMPPFRVDVTRFLKKGRNDVSIQIANTIVKEAELELPVQLLAETVTPIR